MSTISIEGMEFHAYHGCFAEEQVIGNTFIVDLHLDTEADASELSDNLDETVDYAAVFEIVKEQMSIKSKLLEHVGRRILDNVLERFPEVDFAEVKVSKLNPPVGGKVHSVSVTLDNIDPA